MQVISINTGQPKTVQWKNQTVTTSIFKNPVQGSVNVNQLGIESDTQSDLSVHGGKYKAVYAYPSENYVYWERELPHFSFQWGTFGENLTTLGLTETEVCLGDRYKIGTVELKVVQPRFPCMKIGVRFEDPFMVKRFLDSRLSGFYFQIVKEGTFEEGDSIELLEKVAGISIRSFVDIYASKTPDLDKVQAVLEDPHLLDHWKEYFESKLAQVS